MLLLLALLVAGGDGQREESVPWPGTVWEEQVSTDRDGALISEGDCDGATDEGCDSGEPPAADTAGDAGDTNEAAEEPGKSSGCGCDSAAGARGGWLLALALMWTLARTPSRTKPGP